MPRDAQGNAIVAQKEFALGREAFVRTDDGSELMSVDGVGSGVAVNLWNGTGVSDTGGDWTRTGVGSESASANHGAGTNGLDTGVMAQNDECIFDNGSMINVNGMYSALEFWMQPKAYPAGSKFRLRWVDSADSVVGNQVLINNYVANMDTDIWQKVSIPIVDFGLTGNVQKLELRYRSQAGQHFWFDGIELITAAGDGPYRFRIEAPDAATIYHLSMAVVLLSAPESGWLRSAFSNIAGGLTKGLLFRHRRVSTGDILWKFNVKNNVQLFGQYHPQESFVFADTPAELLVGFMIKPGKANVRITNDDVLEFVVRDDLTDITEMRAFCHFGVEDIS